jgi:hypothetical protein
MGLPSMGYRTKFKKKMGNSEMIRKEWEERPRIIYTPMGNKR